MRRHLARAGGLEDDLDGRGRVARVEDGARQERDDARLVGSDDSPVEKLTRRRLELGARRVVQRRDHHLGSAPDVDEDLALAARPAGPPASRGALKEAPMRPFERPEPPAFVGAELAFHLAPEAPSGHGVAPERPAALLKPRVFGSEGPGPRLEARAHLGHALSVAALAAELDDPRRGLEHSHSARAGVLCRDRARMENRIFFPQVALDEWIVEGTAELQDGELTLLRVGRRYRLAEAIHVVKDASGGGDAELLGRVKARVYLEQLGAEIVETSMLLGDAAYDVEPGWIGVPAVPFAEYAAASGKGGKGAEPRGERPVEPRSDEELLARFSLKGP